MPAPVVVVHDEVEACEAMLRALSEAGLDAIGFTNPMAALDAVETDSKLQVLVTRMSFGPGKLTSLALFRMLEYKRAGRLRAVFIGRADYRQDAEQDGVFLLRPADPQAVVEAVRQQLKLRSTMALRMTTAPIVWQGPVVPAPVAVPLVTAFSPRTEELLRDARREIGRAHALRQRCMPVRQAFASR